MKLQQGQVWKQGAEYLRIVSLDRTKVEYKSMLKLTTKDGTHISATKKAFCRLLKGAILLSAEEVRQPSSPVPVPSEAAASAVTSSGI